MSDTPVADYVQSIQDEPGPEVQAALTALASESAVQAAIWRLWTNGPGILDPTASLMITEAYVRDFNNQRSAP